MGRFEIDATDLCWIDKSQNYPEDLCLHGHAVAIIGSKKLEYDATVSATALYLLKSLTEDHLMYRSNQLLPCCGFDFYPNEQLDTVDICGCPNGIDWTVMHRDNDVILLLEDGTEIVVSFEDYQREVFRFADKIEDFYRACPPRKAADDMRDGYIAFWNEWHRRRNRTPEQPAPQYYLAT